MGLGVYSLSRYLRGNLNFQEQNQIVNNDQNTSKLIETNFCPPCSSKYLPTVEEIKKEISNQTQTGSIYGTNKYFVVPKIYK